MASLSLPLTIHAIAFNFKHGVRPIAHIYSFRLTASMVELASL